MGKYKKHLIDAEGKINHMYCDTLGNVTVGVGYLLAVADIADQLPFIDKDSGQNASIEDIIGAYNQVKSEYQPDTNLSAGHYKNVTKLILPDTAIEQLLEEKIDEFEQVLIARLPNFERYPDSVKVALMDMVYNLGSVGLFRKFPKMIHAVRLNDWEIAANECNRIGISESRNEKTKQLFLSVV